MIIVSVGGINGKSEEGESIEKEKKKMGRPTDNPKNYRSVVRMDEETNLILEKYCAKESVTKMEAIRRGIRELKKFL